MRLIYQLQHTRNTVDTQLSDNCYNFHFEVKYFHFILILTFVKLLKSAKIIKLNKLQEKGPIHSSYFIKY